MKQPFTAGAYCNTIMNFQYVLKLNFVHYSKFMTIAGLFMSNMNPPWPIATSKRWMWSYLSVLCWKSDGSRPDFRRVVRKTLERHRTCFCHSVYYKKVLHAQIVDDLLHQFLGTRSPSHNSCWQWLRRRQIVLTCSLEDINKHRWSSVTRRYSEIKISN